jgi:hypothetical protein
MTHTITAQPVAYLWQHTITRQTKALMRDDVFTAGPHWRLVGPLHLATESTVNQGMTVQTPPLTQTAKRKLDDLQDKGFRIVGYALEHCNILQDNRRCTVDYNGLVRWYPSTEQEVVKERTARQAAQVEVVELKERIARAGVEQRRAVSEAVLEEREACAKVCDPKPGIRYSPNAQSVRQQCAAAIRARQ